MKGLNAKLKRNMYFGKFGEPVQSVAIMPAAMIHSSLKLGSAKPKRRKGIRKRHSFAQLEKLPRPVNRLVGIGSSTLVQPNRISRFVDRRSAGFVAELIALAGV